MTTFLALFVFRYSIYAGALTRYVMLTKFSHLVSHMVSFVVEVKVNRL